MRKATFEFVNVIQEKL